jgi:hypothetical protein
MEINKNYSSDELKKILEKIRKPVVSELQGETIKQRLLALIEYLNKRYNVNYNLMDEKNCGATATFKGCPSDKPPTPPKTITFNWTGKYSTSIKEAVAVFLHEYAHILLVDMGWRDYEEYCTQFADVLLKEIEVACPEFLYGDVDTTKEYKEEYKKE